MVTCRQVVAPLTFGWIHVSFPSYPQIAQQKLAPPSNCSGTSAALLSNKQTFRFEYRWKSKSHSSYTFARISIDTKNDWKGKRSFTMEKASAADGKRVSGRSREVAEDRESLPEASSSRSASSVSLPVRRESLPSTSSDE